MTGEIAMNEITITLGLEECCAIAARAEVEKTVEKPGVWSKLWERVNDEIAKKKKAAKK